MPASLNEVGNFHFPFWGNLGHDDKAAERHLTEDIAGERRAPTG
jgi:hypothetical protein